MIESEVCCEGSYPSDMYGPAFTRVVVEVESGEMWIDNGEYSTRVNYCPICGNKAPKDME